MRRGTVAAIMAIGTLLVNSGPPALGESPVHGARPDFSGTWRFDPAKSGLEMNAPTSSLFVIEHQDPRFKLTRTHTWGERSDTLSFESTTDGEERYKEDRGYESWTRMYWMGHELVLDMKLAHRGEKGTNVVHYKLADEGDTFIAAEWYHMPGEQHHNYWVFERVMEE